MSGGSAVIRNRPYTSGELSNMVDDHEARLDEIYPSAVVVAKIWSYLKYATPAMILAMLGNINPDSPLGHMVAYVWKQITNG